ncbi:MAG: DNA cytosine methyltransferase [Candidatus Electrothrix sp. EH2]|nr:DNA cytosine methyltransferase [Candidatus Electrothrix sp. EH2]
MKIFDLFCGTGGFSKGFEKAAPSDYEVVFGLDLLKSSVKTFQLNHTRAFGLAGDIRKVRKQDISDTLNLGKGDIDVILGGPPCQGFSSIRPFRSTNDDDPRNTLFEEFASFINYFRPKVFVMENVVGLATHKNGETIELMQQCFSSLAYDTDWRILNAAHYGVPQKRERLIFLGVQKGGKLSFPKPTHSHDGVTIGVKNKQRHLVPEKNHVANNVVLPKAYTVEDAIGDLPEIPSGGSCEQYTKPPVTDYQRERRNGCKLLKLHKATDHSEKMLEIIKHSGKNIHSIPKNLITSGFSSCYSRLDGNEPAVTITVNFVHPASNRCIHPRLNRALTPREGARLQSFDDDFEFSGNRSQIVKQIGNAVPPLLGKAIAEELSRSVLS